MTIPRLVWALPIAAAITLFASCGGGVGGGDTQTQAASGTSLPLGALVHDGPATPEQISLFLPVTGSLPQSATATVRYKPTSSSTWTTGHPLYRIQPSLTDTSQLVVGTVPDAFAWPIIGVAPGTSYDVEVTVTSGATTNIKTLTHTTRALPPAAGTPNKTANSVATITSQLASLNPGDVLEIANGTYNVSGLVLNRSGTANSPIYIRGQSRAGVVLSNPGRVLYIQNASHVVIENMTLQGSGNDSGTNASSEGIGFFDGSPTQTRITVRNMTITGVDVGIKAHHEIAEFLGYDNTLTGNNTWTPGVIDTNSTWNDDGINISGFGNCAFNNTLRGFGDNFAVDSQQLTTDSVAIHFYRNDVSMGGDDGFEVDGGHRNITFYDNRMRNTMTFISLDPLFGGPLLVARNIVINTGRTPFKWNSTNAGQFLYNNTVIRTTGKYAVVDGTPAAEAGWYQPNNGDQRAYGYRNNILVYRGSGTQTIRLDNSGHDPVDFTHNSWFPNGIFQWPTGTFANLAAAYAGLGATTPLFSGITKRHEQDNITVSNPWTTTITLGADYHTEVTVPYTPVLSSGTAPKNSGVVIPNITDGFSGGTPDRGAIIEGRPIPQYGDRGTPSWVNALAIGQWYVIPNTAMSSVEPSPTPAGIAGPVSKITAWTSFVADPRTSKVYSVANGGHSDYSGNEVDALDLERDQPVWTQVLAPTPGASVVSGNYYLDGRPTSRHTYYGVTLDESNDRVMLFGGSRWQDGDGTLQIDSYNIGANSYNPQGTHPGLPSDFIELPACAVNPLTGDVYLNLNFSLGRWNRSANTFETLNPIGASKPHGYYATSAFDSSRGRILFLGGDNADHHIYTLSTNTFAQITLNGANAADVSGVRGAAMVYVAAIDRFLIEKGGVGGTVYQVNPSTFEVTTFATTGGASIPSTQNGPFNKFLYVPRLRGAVYVPSYSGNAWFLRLH
jgi:hypothetical protein